MQKPPIFYAGASRIPKGAKKIDAMESALTELYFIENPQIPKNRSDKKLVQQFVAKHPDKGVWVYYPWRGVAVKIPTEEVYKRLRTARNRNLILPAEQKKYAAGAVGI